MSEQKLKASADVLGVEWPVSLIDLRKKVNQEFEKAVHMENFDRIDQVVECFKTLHLYAGTFAP